MNKILRQSGDRLKLARIEAGYKTAKDFYKNFDIKASTYFAHESNRNPLNLKTAKQYGELLNTSSTWLLTGEEDKQNELGKYVLHYGQVPRDILLNKMLNEVTVQYIKSAGIQKGMTAAEFGCGTGSMACWLAENVGNSGFVYAIDRGYEQLSITKKRASELNINNIEYIRKEITDELPNIKPDLIYIRCFLHHLKNPKKFIEAISNFLPKGGILICMEPIISTFWSYPNIPEMQKAINLYLELGNKNEFDFDIGAKLYGYLCDTNKFETFKTYIHHGLGVTKDEKSWIEMITSECATRYIEEKLITESELDKLLLKINQHIEKNDTIATLPSFVCITAKKS